MKALKWKRIALLLLVVVSILLGWVWLKRCRKVDFEARRYGIYRLASALSSFAKKHDDTAPDCLVTLLDDDAMGYLPIWLSRPRIRLIHILLFPSDWEAMPTYDKINWVYARRKISATSVNLNWRQMTKGEKASWLERNCDYDYLVRTNGGEYGIPYNLADGKRIYSVMLYEKFPKGDDSGIFIYDPFDGYEFYPMEKAKAMIETQRAYSSLALVKY